MQDENQAEEEEHFHNFTLIDLPFTLSVSAVFLYWLVKGEQMRPDTREGVLGGAILMQFVTSTLLFAIIKERLMLQPGTRRLEVAAAMKAGGSR